MIVVVLMGILAAIAIPSFFGVVEGRNVDGAANQVAADLRLAHSSSVNRLGTASLSFDDVAAGGGGLTVTCNGVADRDYCLVRPGGGGMEAIPRTLPDGIMITSRGLTGGTVANINGRVTGADRSIYFDNSGAARFAGSSGTPVVAGSCSSGTPTIIVASEDGNPSRCITVAPATSKVEID